MNRKTTIAAVTLTLAGLAATGCGATTDGEADAAALPASEAVATTEAPTTTEASTTTDAPDTTEREIDSAALERAAYVVVAMPVNDDVSDGLDIMVRAATAGADFDLDRSADLFDEAFWIFADAHDDLSDFDASDPEVIKVQDMTLEAIDELMSAADKSATGAATFDVELIEEAVEHQTTATEIITDVVPLIETWI